MLKKNFTYRILQRISGRTAGLIVLLIINISFVYAKAPSGNPKKNEADSLKAKARQCERHGDIYGAIDYYDQYLSIENKDIKASYKLANMYFDTRNYAKANIFYDSVIAQKSKKYPLAYYRKGIVCMNLEEYDDAIEVLTKFRRIYKHHKDPNNYRRIASTYIESSTWAKNQTEIENKYEVFHLNGDLNHSNIDFSPFPIDSATLIYGAEYADNEKGIGPVRQLFMAQKENEQWITTGLLESEINNPVYNTGNAVISTDGQRMYFTRARNNWKGEVISEIFISYYNNDEWSEPEKLPFPINDENYTSTQPAIGINPRTGREILYFVSNRPEGKGGLDIWYTEYNTKTGLYKNPRVLSRTINTYADECCPFYNHVTTTLYFSSNGREQSFGGYDVYKATGSGNNWTDVISMPKPINSPYDEYYFSILGNNKEGFFTSNRPGSLTLDNGHCCDDIFTYRANECTMVNSFGVIRNQTNFDFYDDLNRKYNLQLSYPKDGIVLADVSVELYLPGQNEADEVLVSTTTSDENGIYRFNLERDRQYKIRVKNYGYFEKKVPVSTMHVNCSDTVDIGTAWISFLPKLNFMVYIYYDFDKYKLSDDAKRVIDTTMLPLFDLFPNAIIEIGSHTDSTGTDLYNLKLSQNRSQSVVDYIISNGIAKERLVAKGYGMRFPIAPNTNSDGSDNPEGRQRNRRTEIRIVGEISPFDLDE